MNTHIRQIAVIAGLVFGTVSAQAQVATDWNGSAGTLTWSQLAVETLNVGSMKVYSFGDTVAYPTVTPDNTYDSIAVGIPSTGAQWLPAEGTPNQLLSWQTAGGFRIDAPPVSGVSSGGSVTVSNLDVNFATGQVSATVLAGNSGTSTRSVIWTFDSSVVQVSTDASPQWPSLHDVSIDIPVLSLTNSGQSLLASGLNLQYLGGLTLQVSGDNYASLTINGTLPGPADFTVAVVPEPATWALMGLGLVGLTGLSRARSRQSCAESV